MTEKGVPKKDGSGQGNRVNINRKGCNSPSSKGKGRK